MSNPNHMINHVIYPSGIIWRTRFSDGINGMSSSYMTIHFSIDVGAFIRPKPLMAANEANPSLNMLIQGHAYTHPRTRARAHTHSSSAVFLLSSTAMRGIGLQGA